MKKFTHYIVEQIVNKYNKMFQCKMNKIPKNQSITHFKTVFDLYEKIGIQEVFFNIKPTGIYIYTTYDNSIHVETIFSNNFFLEYMCEKDAIFTLKVNAMKVRNLVNTDSLEMGIRSAQDAPLVIRMSTKTIDFEKKIAIKKTQSYKLPELIDVTPLTIKSADFLEFCKSINGGKYTLSIKTKKSEMVNGVLQRGEIIFEAENSRIVIRSETPIESEFEGEFKSEYFSSLRKVTKFNTTLKIYLCPDHPLIFETTIGPKEKDKVIVWIKSLKQMEEEYHLQKSIT
ncbi:hypothetical protein MIV060L [Invertebrate iridescent virus 3]|uniref:Uncharacterized protein 060L n=1 Tax=Invertebrate iridescent virus 3 TaxID=345201 RepID=VF436_IIV3|nr:hypothetical protein MIV060L [Invertebrate iridescent virus 3]Q197A0.1 RecName: Full=Uncharacterized protein 060L [Invertebrate iridescent virus 3]ABF82090.1 hypothetical protein MIV060L [Invertebrate iridescent virus 3]